MKKSQTATTPTSSLKRPSIVTKGNKTLASARNGHSSIPVKSSSTGPRQPGVSTGLSPDLSSVQDFRERLDGLMLFDSRGSC